MILLVCGLLLWSLVHLIPTVGISIKQRWISALGLKRYIRTFMLLIITSLVLIVLGWRSASPTHLYFLPPFVQSIAIALIVFAFILFVAATHPTRIKRFVRHPQLTGVALWAVAHLLLNGDSRSVLLFGWLGIWAVLEIILINKREGNWIKQPVPEAKLEAKVFVKAAIGITVIALLHPYFTGMHAIEYLHSMISAVMSRAY